MGGKLIHTEDVEVDMSLISDVTQSRRREALGNEHKSPFLNLVTERLGTFSFE